MAEKAAATTPMPPIKLAFVIDNTVVDILHTDDRLAAIFLSQPLILDVTGEDGEPMCKPEDVYDPATGKFTTPEAI